MKNIDILNLFCGEAKNNSEPFSIGLFTYATDGWGIVRVPKVEGVGEKENVPDVLSLRWDHEIIREWNGLPVFDVSNATECLDCCGSGCSKTCLECSGDGEICFENDYNEYACECSSCEGSGVVPSLGEGDVCASCNGSGKNFSIPVKFGHSHINMKALIKLSNLPGVKIKADGIPLTPYRFIYDDGEWEVHTFCSSWPVASVVVLTRFEVIGNVKENPELIPGGE